MLAATFLQKSPRAHSAAPPFPHKISLCDFLRGPYLFAAPKTYTSVEVRDLFCTRAENALCYTQKAQMDFDFKKLTPKDRFYIIILENLPCEAQSVQMN